MSLDTCQYKHLEKELETEGFQLAHLHSLSLGRFVPRRAVLLQRFSTWAWRKPRAAKPLQSCPGALAKPCPAAALARPCQHLSLTSGSEERKVGSRAWAIQGLLGLTELPVFLQSSLLCLPPLPFWLAFPVFWPGVFLLSFPSLSLFLGAAAFKPLATKLD